MPTPRRISDFKPVLTNLAQTSHYQVIFSGLSGQLLSYLGLRGVDTRFITDTVGILCDSAQIPGSSFSTADVVGNYTGVAEKFAHARIFTQIDLDFYVDKDYKTIKFLEHWIEFIASGSNQNPSRKGYFFRMQYPSYYKTDQTKIIKFDRDYNAELEYTFYGMFPLSLNATPVTYNYSDILRVSASFNFDRYVCGKTSSFDYFAGIDNNKDPNSPRTNTVRDNTFSQRAVDSNNPDFGNPLGVINNPTINDFGSKIETKTITPSVGYDSTFEIA